MKKIVYIDMDDVLCDFIGNFNKAKQSNPEIEYPQSKKGFWINLPPLKNAVESVEKLKSKYDVYVLTAPSVFNPVCYSEKREWVEKYLGFEMCHKLIISPNKALNKGHYLIDDYTEGKGQDNFEGELINFGSEKFKNWNLVCDYLGV